MHWTFVASGAFGVAFVASLVFVATAIAVRERDLVVAGVASVSMSAVGACGMFMLFLIRPEETVRAEPKEMRTSACEIPETCAAHLGKSASELSPYKVVVFEPEW
jgi:hypothetical protein